MFWVSARSQNFFNMTVDASTPMILSLLLFLRRGIATLPYPQPASNARISSLGICWSTTCGYLAYQSEALVPAAACIGLFCAKIDQTLSGSDRVLGAFIPSQ